MYDKKQAKASIFRKKAEIQNPEFNQAIHKQYAKLTAQLAQFCDLCHTSFHCRRKSATCAFHKPNRLPLMEQPAEMQ